MAILPYGQIKTATPESETAKKLMTETATEEYCCFFVSILDIGLQSKKKLAYLKVWQY